MSEVHPLIGKYVFISNENYYKYGRIIENVDVDIFLVKIISGDILINSYSLYNINQMIQDDNSHITGWQIFKTKADLNKYLKWIETPTENSENKVLQLVKKNGEKI
jgi:hypothetical protein